MIRSPLNVILCLSYAISEAAKLGRLSWCSRNTWFIQLLTRSCTLPHTPHDADGLRRSRPPAFRAAFRRDSVSAQHQCLDRKQQGLDSQQHRVHEADGIDGMQREALERAGVL
jgi:hypothetical protein